MIGQIRGVIVAKKPPCLVVDVNGIGYELQASMNTFYQLPEVQETVTLLTCLQTREDGMYLYGFSTEPERLMFKELIKVSGVGPKLALTILSSMDVLEFATCIEQKEIRRLVGIPGIGKKTAERLVVEMRDRLMNHKDAMEAFSSVVLDAKTNLDELDAKQDAINALVALGYKANEAKKVIQPLAKEGHNSETLIRHALQSLAKGMS